MATQTEVVEAPRSIAISEDEKQTAAQDRASASSTTNSHAEQNLDEPANESQRVKPPRDLHGIIWVLVVVSVLSADFLFALDNTIVADVQPSILLDLGEVGKLPWVSVAFALGGVAVNLIWQGPISAREPNDKRAGANDMARGKLFGQFDNKTLFLATVLIFEVGSAICGAAPNMNALIVGRAICGVGGAGIYLGAVNILSALTTRVERPMYLGFAGLTWGAGTV